MRIRHLFISLAIASLALGSGCGEGGDRSVSGEAASESGEPPAATAREREKALEHAVEEGAEVVEENVERSGHVAKETYEEDRTGGEGRIDAAGDAYEAVREIPLKKKTSE